MIRLGLNSLGKQSIINTYIKENAIKKIFIFYPDKFPNVWEFPVPVEYIRHADIIMYKFFYRLLEEIDSNTLLVFNECLRTQNRSDLTYNCAHHYCNQTEHKIIFEYFPFIEDKDDFMILLDLINKGKYKGKSFDWQYLKDEDIKNKQINIIFSEIDCPITENDKMKYEKKKEELFNNLGNSDPDTIPRQLHLFTGNLKREAIQPDLKYVARNDRFKLSNITTYKETKKENYIVVDMPHRRIDFNDFLKITGMTDIKFINTGLKVDLFYAKEFREWIERLEEFYAKTSLY